jgi:hypothetical protein
MESWWKHDGNVVETYGNPSGNVRETLGKLRSKRSGILMESLGKPGANPGGNPNGNVVPQNTTKTNPLKNLQPLAAFKLLSKTQRAIAYLLYNKCKNIREEYTEAVPSKYLVEACGASINTIRSAIADLMNHQIIAKRMFKGGPAGWTDYWYNPTSYEELAALELAGKLTENVVETLWNHGANPSGNRGGNSLSSSSINLNTNTTETKDTDLNKPPLPEEWKTGLDWTTLEMYFGTVSVNEKTGVYRAQLDLPANAHLKDSPPLTLNEIQNSIDRMTWDYDNKKYTSDSNHAARSRLFGILNKRGHYTAQASGFKTRKARQAEQLQKELDEEARIVQAAQDSKFELVQMKWLQIQNLNEIRTKHSIYNIAFNDERLIGMVKSHFKQQNYSKVVMENITDHTKLGIDFSLLDQ